MKKFCVLVSYSGNGGVERNVTKLVKGFLDKGLDFELLTIKEKGIFFNALPKEVKKIKLPFEHAILNIPFLVKYLREKKPYAIFSVKDRANRIAIISRFFARTNTKIIIRLGTNLTASLKHRGVLRLWFRYLPSRLLYPNCDRIIAVSKGVAQDISRITKIPLKDICVLPNPVVDNGIKEMAEEEVEDPWFLNKKYPLILGAGRLTEQKDFETGIKAIKLVKEKGLKVRYVILGDGEKRKELQILIESLGLKDNVRILGFKNNPYKYMKRSDLFLLSSKWEGLPNALIEAMSLGVPVVSTDCPSGPWEILKGGTIAPLVKVGDPIAMAEAIVNTLKSNIDISSLIKAAEEFSIDKSVDSYAKIILD